MKRHFISVGILLLLAGCSQYSSYLDEQGAYVKQMTEKEGIKSVDDMTEQFLDKIAEGYKKIAFDWANRGDAEAQFELGLNYLNGEKQVRFEQDSEEAIKWLEQAANNGNAQAASVLAALYEDMSWLSGYEDDDGVPTNHLLRLKWLKHAAELGDTDSMNGLGYSMENGTDGEFNLVQAYAWQAVAETLGASGLTSTDALEEKMTAVQLNEAKRIFQEKLPKVRAEKAAYCTKYPQVTMMVFRRASGSRPCVQVIDSK